MEKGPGPRAPGSALALQVVAGVIVGPRGFLLARRRAGDHMGGRWEFPGGKREVGETEVAALARELREELGIVAQIGRKLGTTHHTYPDARGPVALHFYLCTILSGVPQPLASQEIGWFSAPALPSLDWPAANWSMAARLAHPGWLRDGTGSP